MLVHLSLSHPTALWFELSGALWSGVNVCQTGESRASAEVYFIFLIYGFIYI